MAQTLTFRIEGAARYVFGMYYVYGEGPLIKSDNKAVFLTA